MGRRTIPYKTPKYPLVPLRIRKSVQTVQSIGNSTHCGSTVSFFAMDSASPNDLLRRVGKKVCCYRVQEILLFCSTRQGFDLGHPAVLARLALLVHGLVFLWQSRRRGDRFLVPPRRLRPKRAEATVASAVASVAVQVVLLLG